MRSSQDDNDSLPVLLLRPPSSPSQRCKVYTQKGVMPATPSLSSHTLAQDSQAPEALTSDSKASLSMKCFRSAFHNYSVFDWFAVYKYISKYINMFKEKMLHLIWWPRFNFNNFKSVFTRHDRKWAGIFIFGEKCNCCGINLN